MLDGANTDTCMSETSQTIPMRGSSEGSDYDVIRRAISFLSETWTEHPDLDRLSAHLGLSSTHTQKLFKRWCGLSPKEFVQAITIDHARSLLDGSASVLDTALDVGLSGSGRLHDWFVDHEALTPGDPVVTRRGPQVLRWVGRRHVSPFELRRRPGLRPVVLRAGALGPGCPAADTPVSPQHRVMVGGGRLQLLFGHACALAPAKGLIDGMSVLPAPSGTGVDYIHLLFDRHEVIRANGMWTESLLLAPVAERAVQGWSAAAEGPDTVDVVGAPPGIVHDAPALPLLRPHEARLWRRAVTGQAGRRAVAAA